MSRGQAALEFLSTYGWAILIVLVMIGALSYFGVTNPQRLLPDKCVFKAGLGCRDFVALESGSDTVLRFTLSNGMGKTFSISEINATYLGGTTLNEACAPDGTALPATVPSEASQGFTCTFAALTLAEGTPVKFTVDLAYREVQGVYDRRAGGEISTTVT